MSKNECSCDNCKHCDRRPYVKEDGFYGYCVEDGDQVGLLAPKHDCWGWKDENDKTPDIQWD